MSEANGENLPPGWTEVPLRELLLPAATVNPRNQGAGTFDYIDIEAVDNERQRISAPRQLPNADAPSRARNAVLPGDVIFSLVRPYLRNVAIVPPNLSAPVASTAFFVCRPGAGVDSRFLHNFLRQHSFIAGVTTYGNSPPAARDDEFERLPIVVAPVAEQQRIADALDELFSDLDAGVAALERVREKLKLYRASVLKAAVEGALTVEWRAQHPRTEPASELLERIHAERRHLWEGDQLAKFKTKGQDPPKNWKAKYKESGVPDSSLLPPLPDGWCWSSLGECFEVHVGATPSRAVEDYWNGDIPWVASGEVQFCRILDTREKITEAGLANSSTRINPAGSVILNMIGEGSTRGKAGILNIAACNNQNCAAIWVSRTPMQPQFVYLWLLYRYEQTRELGSGNNQPAMNKGIVESIALPLPSLAEQEAIVEAVEDQLSVIDHLEADLDAKLKNAQSLRQAILRHAFTGQLVPQDPDDEPASELLKRIAAEREARSRSASMAKRATGRPRPRRRPAPQGPREARREG